MKIMPLTLTLLQALRHPWLVDVKRCKTHDLVNTREDLSPSYMESKKVTRNKP